MFAYKLWVPSKGVWAKGQVRGMLSVIVEFFFDVMSIKRKKFCLIIFADGYRCIFIVVFRR